MCAEYGRRGGAARAPAEKRRDMLFYVSAGVAVVVILAIGLIFG